MQSHLRQHATATRRASFSLGAITLWLALGAAVYLIAIIGRTGTALSADFRSFYAAGKIIRHQPGQLYNLGVQLAAQRVNVSPSSHLVPFYHPSFEALLYAPFSLLTYNAAYLAYITFNLLLLVACYHFAPLPRGPAMARFPRPLLFFAPLPMLMCLVEGQNAILFLLLLCLIWCQLDRGRDATAGALLAVGLFKIPLALTILCLLSLRRGWRILFGFAAAALPLALLCVGLTGWTATRDWVRLLASATLAHDQSAAAQISIAVYPAAMPSISGLLYLLGTRFLSSVSAFLLNSTVSVCVLVLSALLVRHARNRESAFSTAVLCSVLISPHLYLSDLAVLVLPLILLSSRLQFAGALLFCLLPYLVMVTKGWTVFALNAIIPLLLFSGELVRQFRADPPDRGEPV